jgi:predicted esterase
MLDELRLIPGADRCQRVSVQALHRFYTRGDRSVVASWMTREDRELAIADNVEYVNRAIDAVLAEGSARSADATIVFLGFSQGASMAARAAAGGRHRAAGVIMLGGDIPADVRSNPSFAWPPLLIACGDQDAWYGARVDDDVSYLAGRGIPHEVVRFAGGHEFTDAFRARAGAWLADLLR